MAGTKVWSQTCENRSGPRRNCHLEDNLVKGQGNPGREAQQDPIILSLHDKAWMTIQFEKDPLMNLLPLTRSISAIC